MVAGASGEPPHAASGWLEAAGFVVAIGALSVVYAIGHALGAHPIAFILYAMVASAAATLAIVGPGPNAKAMMLHPSSWLIGIAIILIEVFYYQTLAYVAPAHGNLMVRAGVPLALAFGWAALGRRPPPLAIAGGIAIAGAIAYLVAVTAPDVRWPMAASGILTGLVMAVRGYGSEFHPWNRAARTVREKLQVTGTVVLVTSITALALTALAAAAIAAGVVAESRIVPTAAQLMHGPTILTAVMAFSPLAVWAIPEIAVAAGLIEAARPEPRIVVVMVVCIAAVLMIIGSGVRARRLRRRATARACATWRWPWPSTPAVPPGSSRPGPARPWRRWAWPTRPSSARASSRGARSSAWPSPARWPAGRASCWPTSPRPRSTSSRGAPWWTCCRAWPGSRAARCCW